MIRERLPDTVCDIERMGGGAEWVNIALRDRSATIELSSNGQIGLSVSCDAKEMGLCGHDYVLCNSYEALSEVFEILEANGF
jgi:hypothetical protein